MQRHKVCHFTTVHPWNDVRIFYRECKTLANDSFEVTLFAPSEKSFSRDNVYVSGVNNFESRFKRLLIGQFQMASKLIKTDYNIYHFHDPELILTGFLLVLWNKKVVFDIHENVAKQIKDKDWLVAPKFFSKLYKLVERMFTKRFHLVLAENSYHDYYKSLGKSNTVVLNFPDISFFKSFREQYQLSQKSNRIFYIGGVSKNRGAFQMIEALNKLKSTIPDVHFDCIGKIEPEIEKPLADLVSKYGLEKNVTYYGKMDISEAYHIALKCKVGVSILLPIENYLESYSTKIFEYMAIGMPFLTSNFPLYQKVIETSNAGICCDPYDIEGISRHLQELLSDDNQRTQLGLNGMNSSDQKFNWDTQYKKLKQLYTSLINE